MTQSIINYTNKFNFRAIADLYGIMIPEDKGIMFVKNEIKGYGKILQRGKLAPPKDKNLELYTSEELVRAYPFLEILPRIQMIKNLRIYLDSDVQLLPRQIAPFEKMMDRYEEDFFYINTGKPGTGKTIIATLSAKAFGMPIIAILPKRLIHGWKEDANRCGVKLLKVITYGGLSSKTGYQPKHGLLVKEGKNDSKYVPTQQFLDYLDMGVLIVYDEFSKIKNKGPSRSKAALAINKALMSRPTKSRILFLSGTPITSGEQVENLMRLTGIIRHKVLNTGSGKNFTLLGIQDAIEECEKINKKATEYITHHVGNYKNRESMVELLLSLYSEILKDKISGGMPAPELKGIHLQIRNIYYDIDENNLKKLNNALHNMGIASKKYIKSKKGKENESKEERVSRVRSGLEAQKAFLTGRVSCEKAKVVIIERVVKNLLETVPNAKVMICCNFYEGVITKLEKIFEDYNPLLYHGKLSAKVADGNAVKFNKQNLKNRILICTTKSGGLGLNFQDKTKLFPRYMFLMPDNSMETIYQAPLRIYREGTASDCNVSVVFAKGASKEVSLLTSMVRQSGVTKLVLDSKTLEESMFPDDYPSFYENGEPFIDENEIEMEKIVIKVPDYLK